jgi:hypothetical protein
MISLPNNSSPIYEVERLRKHLRRFQFRNTALQKKKRQHLDGMNRRRRPSIVFRIMAIPAMRATPRLRPTLSPMSPCTHMIEEPLHLPLHLPVTCLLLSRHRLLSSRPRMFLRKKNYAVHTSNRMPQLRLPARTTRLTPPLRPSLLSHSTIIRYFRRRRGYDGSSRLRILIHSPDQHTPHLLSPLQGAYLPVAPPLQRLLHAARPLLPAHPQLPRAHKDRHLRHRPHQEGS